MIRLDAPSPRVEWIDADETYLRTVAGYHNKDPFLSPDGTRWNLVLPLPAVDMVLVYVAPVVYQ